MEKEKIDLLYIPQDEFSRIINSSIDLFKKLELVSEMCRLNTFSAVKNAGSGHLGSSLSSIDIMVYLYLIRMNVIKKGIKSPDRDVFFSSKGHDCPGQYSVLVAAKILSIDRLMLLRRLGGLDGHPDVKIPGIETNSGSLGMGISKAKGMAIAKRLGHKGGEIFVMTGDGELQEGQIWEAMQAAASQKVTGITVIVDHNKIQTDKQVKEIIDLGSLEAKFAAFGWHVERCDGHNFIEIDKAFKRMEKITGKPKILIADTIKGKGVSFMEGPKALQIGQGLYKWHSGAPDDDSFEAGQKEISARVQAAAGKLGLDPVKTGILKTIEKNRVQLKQVAEKVVNAYGEALLSLGKKRADIVVLDADLSADCGLRSFESAFPDRFIENGIAEQDMVSTAGGLALQGFLPIVNSFGTFLAARSNEQIFTNATEGTKIIYVCHFAGLIPAGPGKSHQSLRDISLFGALPNCIIIEPCNNEETARAIEWCIEKADQNCMLRLIISPSPRKIALPGDYVFEQGKGAILTAGTDAVMLAYGPVMLNEALTAAEMLASEGIQLKVVDMPWLNRLDPKWLEGIVSSHNHIFVIDDHSTYGGLGDALLNAFNASDCLRGKRVQKLGIKEYPACGTPQEALSFHGLDGKGLAKSVKETINP
jgi:transketolase